MGAGGWFRPKPLIRSGHHGCLIFIEDSEVSAFPSIFGNPPVLGSLKNRMFGMTKRWLGLSASKDGVTFVDVEVPDDDGPMTVLADDTWKVQKGDRGEAYSFLYQQCSDYISENSIDHVVVKASAVTGKGAAKLGMLHSAEVRGVIIAAAASVCSVKQLTKGAVSRTYGERNVDDYVEDDSFWDAHTTGGKLRKGSREVAMLLVAARDA